MDSVTPVWTDIETDYEKVLALDQPQYVPIIILQLKWHDGSHGAAVRMRFTDEERKQIAEGADLIVTETIFDKKCPSCGEEIKSAYTPLCVQLAMPNTRPFILEEDEPV